MLRVFWENRREFPRINFDASCSYQHPGQSQLDYTITKDLSEGGMGLILDKFIPTGSELVVEFSLRKYAEPIKTKAKLSWITKLPYAQRYRAGLEFKELSQFYKINLLRFLKNEPLISIA